MFKRLFKTEYMDWNDYKEKVDTLEIFWWQQSVRMHNLKI